MASLLSPFANAETQLRPGQTIEISAPHCAQVNVRRTLTQNGDAYLPILGWVAASEQKPSELSSTIKYLLRQKGFESSVKVERVFSPREPISFGGAVKLTGSLPPRPGLTLRDVISLAQPTGLADVGDIQIEGIGRSYSVDADLEPNTVLRAGDLITFGLASRPREMYVLGAVLNPGSYPWHLNMTVKDALTAAGGISGEALRDRINIQRGEESFPALDDQILRRADTVRVPISKDVMKVFVRGAVKRPGLVKCIAGSRLSEVINFAGGFLPRADRRFIRVVHPRGKALTINFMGILVGSKDDVFLSAGDEVNVATFGEGQ